jgi:TolB-like protein
MAALMIIGLSATGVMYRHELFSRTTSPTVARPQVSLAILPFKNASADSSLSWLGATLAEMLTTDIGQSASLRG